MRLRRKVVCSAAERDCEECSGPDQSMVVSIGYSDGESGDGQDLIQVLPAANARSKKSRNIKLVDNNLQYYDSNKRSKRRGARVSRSKEENKLDTNSFEFYMEKLWTNISVVEKRSFTKLDSLWFSLYKEGLTEKPPAQKDKVLKWINERKIFTRKYVFVPIVCWGHWSLLILCNFGQNINAKTQNPCMLLLDSLEKAGPKRLEPDIRSFIRDIYETDVNQPEEKKMLSAIPLLVPKVPQQRNGDECGIFVLYFMYLFMKSAPRNFNIDRYPYFLTEKWFEMEELEKFRKDQLLNNASSSGTVTDMEQFFKGGSLTDEKVVILID